MAITIDNGGAPWTTFKSNTSGTTITSPSFTVGGNVRTLVLVYTCYTAGDLGGPWPTTCAWVGGTPAGATDWVLRVWNAGPSDNGNTTTSFTGDSTSGDDAVDTTNRHHTVRIYTATWDGTPSAQQAVVTRTDGDNNTGIVSVYSLAGAKTTFGNKAQHHSSATEITNTTSQSISLSITASADNSIIIGGLYWGNATGSVTAYDSNTTIDYQNNDGGAQGVAVAFRYNGTTTASTAYTLGINTSHYAWGISVIEVLSASLDQTETLTASETQAALYDIPGVPDQRETLVVTDRQEAAYSGYVITYGGLGGGNSATATFTVPYPATILAGDLLLLHCYTRANTSAPAFSQPTDWSTLVASTATASMGHYAIYYKIATGAETGSLTVTGTTANNTELGIMAGVRRARPNFTLGQESTGTTYTTSQTNAGVTPAEDGSLVVWLAAFGDASADATNEYSGWTGGTNVSGWSGYSNTETTGADATVGIGIGFQSTAAATGTLTVSKSNLANDFGLSYSYAIPRSRNIQQIEYLELLDPQVASISAGAVPNTETDTLSLSDTQDAAYARTFSDSQTDTLTASDINAKAVGLTKGQTGDENLVPTDINAGIKAVAKTQTDTLTASDVNAGLFGIAKTETDTLAASDIDAGLFGIAKTETDTLSSDESEAMALGAGSGISVSETDTLTSDESEAALVGVAKTETDTLTASDVDAAIFGLAKSETDTLTASDVDGALVGIAKTQTDTISASEVEDMLLGTVSGFSGVQTDTLSLSDTNDKQVAITKGQSDILTAAEQSDAAYGAQNTFTGDQFDTLGLTDIQEALFSLAKIESDILVQTDINALLLQLAKTEDDTLTASEQQAGVSAGVGVVVGSQLDTLSLGDSSEAAVGVQPIGFWMWDGMRWVGFVAYPKTAVGHGKGQTDYLVMSEAGASVAVSLTKDQLDTLLVSDQVEASYNKAFSFTQTDTLAALDQMAHLVGVVNQFPVNQIDTMSSGMQAAALVRRAGTQADTATATDQMLALIRRAVGQVDTVVLTDQMTALLSKRAGLNEIFFAGEQFAIGVARVGAQADTLTASDQMAAAYDNVGFDAGFDVVLG